MKDIKRRIKSVGSTRQITKAMELVSSSKLRKAKQRAEQARPYFNELYKSMCEIASANTDFSTVFTQKREIKHRLFIVVSREVITPTCSSWLPPPMRTTLRNRR